MKGCKPGQKAAIAVTEHESSEGLLFEGKLREAATLKPGTESEVLDPAVGSSEMIEAWLEC